MLTDKKVLIIDNDPDFLETRVERLVKSGYKVYQALSIKQSEQLLQNTWVHVAIVDIRLREDYNEKDVSGLVLAKKKIYQSIPKIILTRFPTYQAAREALGPAMDGLPPAVDFIAKQEGPNAMTAAVERAFKNHVRINWTLAIRWTQPSSFTYLTNLIDPDISSERLVKRAAELEDLFRKLFYANEQITIGRILRQGPGQIEVEVYAYGGDELKGQFVVACGKRDLIETEKAHYRKSTPGDTDIGSTDLAEYKETMRFGVIAYRLMGGGELEEMETLAVYYRRYDVDEIKDTIAYLYRDTLAEWHKSEQHLIKDATPQSLYFSWLGLDGKQTETILAKKVEALCAHAQKFVRPDCNPKTLTFHFQPENASVFPNPLGILFNKKLVINSKIRIGIIHGRIDLESVLVNKQGRTWMIGFRHAEPGPLLRDFVYLEDALVTYAAQGMEVSEFYALTQRLITVDALDAHIATDDLSAHQQKLVESVAQIRRLAAERAGNDLHPYFIGLLAASLAHIAQFDETVKYYSNRELIPYIRSLLRAAILAEQLAPQQSENVREDLPKQARNSLWVEEETGQVWVEGREVDLTPQELQLLMYFYQRPGKLCTKKQILAEGLKDPSDLYLVRSKFDNAIRRLRIKIEPNPKRPKYLKTVHGRGFRFEI